MSKAKEPWLVFYGPDGKELVAYTIRVTFAGEAEDTKRLEAARNGIELEEITTRLEMR